MDEKKQEPKKEKSIKEQIDEAVAEGVAKALAATRHQHTPLEALSPELSGRTREEGTLIVTKTGETAAYTEWKYNDGTIRRDMH